MLPRKVKESLLSNRWRLDGLYLWTLLTTCVCLLTTSLQGTGNIIFDTASGLAEKGIAAFKLGRFNESAQAFIALEEYYSEEPVWENAHLAEKILPLAGFASLQAGMFEESIDFFEEYLQNYVDTRDKEIFAIYSKATALKRSGKATEAIEHFQALRARSIPPSLVGIASIHEASIHKKNNDEDLALALLKNVLDSDSSERIKNQARLLSIRYLIESEKQEDALNLLLADPWRMDVMPELAQLSGMAIQLGDWSVSSKLYDKAISAYRHVIPRSILIEKQKAALFEIQSRMKELEGELSISDALWLDFYKGVVSRARGQLATLEKTDDYEEPLNLRKAQSYFQEERLLEAWLLFESLAEADDPSTKRSAHHQWILTAMKCGALDESIAIAEEFIDRYPNSPDIWQIKYLIALSYLDHQAYQKAIYVLESLEQASNDPEKEALANYQIGYCYAQLESYKLARARFSEVEAVASAATLSKKARLWTGLCWFFEGEPRKALQIFQSLALSSSGTPIEMEAAYRSASCLYALQEFGDALAATKAFLNRFPASERTAEAWLLLGSIQQTIGDYEKAITSFGKILNQVESIRHASTIQSAECYLALGKSDEASRILNTSMIQWKDPDRVFEIASMLAGIEVNRGRFLEAKDTLWNAIEKYGNARKSQKAFEIIQQAARLEANTTKGRIVLDRCETKAALENKSTLACRLALAKHLIEGESQKARSAIIEMASEYEKQGLPAEGLAYIGSELLSFGSVEGMEMLEQLISLYPKNRYASLAYLNLAKRAFSNSRYGDCLELLLSIDDAPAKMNFLQDVQLLMARTYAALNKNDLALETFESILKERDFNGEAKAKALEAMGDINARLGKPRQANAYYQRSYALYPAYTNIAASCYFKSAKLLEDELSSSLEALATLEELLRQDRYRETETYSQAKTFAESVRKGIEMQLVNKEEAS